MENLEEIKKIKDNLNTYPTWLLKTFSHSVYNKFHKIGKLTLSTQHFKILSLILLVIIMGISYSRNGDQPTTIVWIGVGVFVVFMLLVWSMIGFTIYNNWKIKKICKEYGITTNQWNSI